MRDNLALPPKIDHRRIGITLNDQTRFRHIATLGAVSDGGITVSPAYVPPEGWLLSEGIMGWGRTGEREDLTTVSRGNGLKLHYHRSGWTSIKSESDGPQVGVKLRPMETLHAKQIFVVTQRVPQDLGWKQKGPRGHHELGMIPGDAFAVVDKWPASVSCIGTIFSHKAVPWMCNEFEGETAPYHIVRGHHAYISYDLRGHGLDAFLTISFTMQFELVKNLASTSLVGMCLANETESTACVRATTADGGHVDGGLSRGEMPNFPRLSKKRTKDRILVQRSVDGPGMFLDRV